MLVLRVWLEPPIVATGSITVPDLGTVVLERVEPQMGGDAESRPMTHASVSVSGDDVKADLSAQWQRFDDAVSMILLAEMGSAKVISVRVERDVPLGSDCPIRIHPCIPTSSSWFAPSGFPQTRRTCSDLPVPTPRARTALGWLVRALRTYDLFERTLFLWVALEALAPTVAVVPTCDRCDQEHPLACPECGVAEASPRVMQSIREHMRGLAHKKSIARLYKLRSEIVHGQMPTDAKAAAKLTSNAMALTLLTIDAVKRELGWKRDEGPTFRLEGGITATSMVGDAVWVFNNEQGRKEPVMVEIHPVIIEGWPPPNSATT